jgi:hypothetical protein
MQVSVIDDENLTGPGVILFLACVTNFEDLIVAVEAT